MIRWSVYHSYADFSTNRAVRISVASLTLSWTLMRNVGHFLLQSLHGSSVQVSSPRLCYRFDLLQTAACEGKSSNFVTFFHCIATLTCEGKSWQICEIFWLTSHCNIWRIVLQNCDIAEIHLLSLPWLLSWIFFLFVQWKSGEQSMKTYWVESSVGNGQDEAQIQLLEGQLTWLVQIISAIIRGRANSSAAGSSMQVW